MRLSKTDKTKEAYIKRAESIVIRYSREKNIAWDTDYNQFIEWFGDLRPNLRKASWRQYKASLVYYSDFKNCPVKYIIKIKNLNGTLCKTKSNNTSANKVKKITDEEMVELTEYLLTKSNKWDHFLQRWLDVGIITGLRPQEWESAYIQGDVLVVHNAKNTNGRCFAASRMLDLSNLCFDDLRDVDLFLKSLKDRRKQDSFDSIYKACRDRLHYVTRKLWPKRKKYLSLYSARHQFCANAKRMFSKVEVAAMMGHKNEATATEHYGKRVDGVDLPTFILPDPEQVRLVQREEKPVFHKNVQ